MGGWVGTHGALLIRAPTIAIVTVWAAAKLSWQDLRGAHGSGTGSLNCSLPSRLLLLLLPAAGADGGGGSLPHARPPRALGHLRAAEQVGGEEQWQPEGRSAARRGSTCFIQLKASPPGPLSACLLLLLQPGVIFSHPSAPTPTRYAEWTEAQLKAASESFVAVLYASAYGNTASLAQVRLGSGARAACL